MAPPCVQFPQRLAFGSDLISKSQIFCLASAFVQTVSASRFAVRIYSSSNISLLLFVMLNLLISNNIIILLFSIKFKFFYNNPLVGIYVSLGGITNGFSGNSTNFKSVTLIIGISSL